MNFLDVAIILLMAICVGLGVYRGLIGSLAKMLGRFLRLVLSLLLVKPVVKLISLTTINEHLFDNISRKFAGISEKFSVNLVGLPQEEINSLATDAFADAKIPKLFRGFLLKVVSVSPETIAMKENVTLANLMGVTIGNIILLVVTFIFLLVIFWLLSKIVLRWSKRLNKGHTTFAKTNKWLGGLFGFVKSILILFVVFILISFFDDFSFMSNAIGYIKESLLGKVLYKISLIIVDNSFDLQQILTEWLSNK